MSHPVQPLTVPDESVGTLVPRRIMVIKDVPNPFFVIGSEEVSNSAILYSKELLVHVMDSPIVVSSTDKPVVGVLIVPAKRERDWLFCTDQGRMTLFHKYYNVSRIIMVMNKAEDSEYYTRTSVDTADDLLVKEILGNDMLSLLLPAGCTDKDLNFLEFEEEVKCILPVCEKASLYHGKILVEGVEIETNGGPRDFRRRVRFLSCPHLVMCDMRLLAVPKLGIAVIPDMPLDELKERQDIMVQDFVVDRSVFIQPEVQAMIASLSLSSEHLQAKYNLKIKPKALCLGVGSGSLPSYMSKELDFLVVGVEKDPDMIFVAKTFLGFEPNENLMLVKGDAVKAVKEMVNNDTPMSLCKLLVDNNWMFTKFDLIVLDVNLGLDRLGAGNCSPVSKCMKQQFFNETELALNQGGLLIVNVISPDFVFSSKLMAFMKKDFGKVWRIAMGSEQQYILVGVCTSERPDDDVISAAALGLEDIHFESDEIFDLMGKLQGCIPSKYFNALVEV